MPRLASLTLLEKTIQSISLLLLKTLICAKSFRRSVSFSYWMPIVVFVPSF